MNWATNLIRTIFRFACRCILSLCTQYILCSQNSALWSFLIFGVFLITFIMVLYRLTTYFSCENWSVYNYMVLVFKISYLTSIPLRFLWSWCYHFFAICICRCRSRCACPLHSQFSNSFNVSTPLWFPRILFLSVFQIKSYVSDFSSLFDYNCYFVFILWPCSFN